LFVTRDRWLLLAVVLLCAGLLFCFLRYAPEIMK
jgi:hypothetical protein